MTYVASALDVTPEIIKAYNQQYPAAAPPATSSQRRRRLPLRPPALPAKK